MPGNKEAIYSNTKNKKIKTKTKQMSSRLKRSESSTASNSPEEPTLSCSRSCESWFCYLCQEDRVADMLFACLSANTFMKSVLESPLKITDHVFVPYVRRGVLNFFVCVTLFLIHSYFVFMYVHLFFTNFGILY